MVFSSLSSFWSRDRYRFWGVLRRVLIGWLRRRNRGPASTCCWSSSEACWQLAGAGDVEIINQDNSSS